MINDIISITAAQLSDFLLHRDRLLTYSGSRVVTQTIDLLWVKSGDPPPDRLLTYSGSRVVTLHQRQTIDLLWVKSGDPPPRQTIDLLWVKSGDLSVGTIEGAVCDLGTNMLSQERFTIRRYTSTHED